MLYNYKLQKHLPKKYVNSLYIDRSACSDYESSDSISKTRCQGYQLDINLLLIFFTYKLKFPDDAQNGAQKSQDASGSQIAAAKSKNRRNPLPDPLLKARASHRSHRATGPKNPPGCPRCLPRCPCKEHNNQFKTIPFPRTPSCHVIEKNTGQGDKFRQQWRSQMFEEHCSTLRDVLPVIWLPTRRSFRRSLRSGGLGTGVDVVDVRRCRGTGSSTLPRRSVYARLDARRRDAQSVSAALRRLLLRPTIRHHSLVESRWNRDFYFMGTRTLRISFEYYDMIVFSTSSPYTLYLGRTYMHGCFLGYVR